MLIISLNFKFFRFFVSIVFLIQIQNKKNVLNAKEKNWFIVLNVDMKFVNFVKLISSVYNVENWYKKKWKFK